MYKGWSGLRFEEFFTINNNDLRGNGAKIFKTRFKSNIGKNSFTNRTINLWNSLPIEAIQCNTLNTFKNKIDKYLKEDKGLI